MGAWWRNGWAAESRRLSSKPIPRGSAWDGPLVVLIDSGTSGPGEIVAAALADTAETPSGGRAHVRAGGELEPRSPPRRRPDAHRGQVHVPVRHLDPRDRPRAVRAGGCVGSTLDDTTDEEAPETDRPDRILEKAIEVLSEKTEQKAAA